jgi:hypothetical protein
MVLPFVPIRPQLRINDISPKKVGLRGQRIKPSHIARGIDPVQMKRFWLRLRHGRILASLASAVQ